MRHMDPSTKLPPNQRERSASTKLNLEILVELLATTRHQEERPSPYHGSMIPLTQRFPLTTTKLIVLLADLVRRYTYQVTIERKY